MHKRSERRLFMEATGLFTEARLMLLEAAHGEITKSHNIRNSSNKVTCQATNQTSCYSKLTIFRVTKGEFSIN